MLPYAIFSARQKGLALLTVLLFMQIIALLSVCAIESVLLETRVTHDFYQRHLLMQAAEYGLGQSEQAWPAECQIAVISTADLLAQPFSWWQSHTSCTGNFQQFKYYYVIEFLGKDACAVLPDKSRADYFRVTVMAADHSGNEKVFLQTTWIKPDFRVSPCAGRVHDVRVGRQSWKNFSI